jgi:hypothetical protein
VPAATTVACLVNLSDPAFPGDLPGQQSTMFELAINLETAGVWADIFAQLARVRMTQATPTCDLGDRDGAVAQVPIDWHQTSYAGEA